MRSLLRGEGGQAAFTTLRNTLGAAILLGLEVLVAADLIRTITSKPSLEDALILGLIVLIRVVLSFSIQVEIEGVAPWRRALLTERRPADRRGRREGPTGRSRDPARALNAVVHGASGTVKPLPARAERG